MRRQRVFHASLHLSLCCSKEYQYFIGRVKYLCENTSAFLLQGLAGNKRMLQRRSLIVTAVKQSESYKFKWIKMAQTQTFVLVGISLTMESRYWLVPANQKYIFYFHASADKRNQLRNSLKFGNIESDQVFFKYRRQALDKEVVTVQTART